MLTSQLPPACGAELWAQQTAALIQSAVDDETDEGLELRGLTSQRDRLRLSRYALQMNQPWQAGFFAPEICR